MLLSDHHAALDQYAKAHTHPEPTLLENLIVETQLTMQAPQMLTGRLEGRFLKLLIQITNARNVLEIGLFTGYSALSMAEGLPPEGSLITCEINEKSAAVAKKYFARSPHGHKITIKMGPALDTLKKLNQEFDFIFIDADKGNYPAYYNESMKKLKPGGLIAIDNALWGGEVLNPEDETARIIDGLNKEIQQDTRVENVLLTVRDGIHVVRKKI